MFLEVLDLRLGGFGIGACDFGSEVWVGVQCLGLGSRLYVVSQSESNAIELRSWTVKAPPPRPPLPPAPPQISDSVPPPSLPPLAATQAVEGLVTWFSEIIRPRPRRETSSSRLMACMVP